MTHTLDAPTLQDMASLAPVRRDYYNRLATICRLIQLEGESSSDMRETLFNAEHIARFRAMACYSAGAAWRKVPLEVWDMIFGFHLESSRQQGRVSGSNASPAETPVLSNSIDNQDWSAMSAPCSILRVCKWWRAAALSTPTVWSSVAIPLVVKGSIVGYIPFIPTQLANDIVPRLNRVANNPIPWSLTLSARGGLLGALEPITGLPFSSVLTSSHPAIHTIQHLKVDTFSFNIAFCGLGSAFPLVSSLVLGWFDKRRNPSVHYLGASPQFIGLRKAVLHNAIDMYAASLPQAIPWSQLTHLLVQNWLPWERMRALLMLCTSLCEACFLAEEFNPEHMIITPTQAWHHTTPNVIISQQHLRALTIICRGEISSSAFTDLAFPVLTKMRIFCDSFTNGDSTSLFSSPLPVLTHLALVLRETERYGGPVADVSSGRIATILDACPSLVHLVLATEGDFGTILEPLASSSEEPRAPKLEILALLWQPDPYAILYNRRAPFPAQVLSDIVPRVEEKQESQIIRQVSNVLLSDSPNGRLFQGLA